MVMKSGGHLSVSSKVFPDITLVIVQIAEYLNKNTSEWIYSRALHVAIHKQLANLSYLYTAYFIKYIFMANTLFYL